MCWSLGICKWSMPFVSATSAQQRKLQGVNQENKRKGVSEGRDHCEREGRRKILSLLTVNERCSIDSIDSGTGDDMATCKADREICHGERARRGRKEGKEEEVGEDIHGGRRGRSSGLKCVCCLFGRSVESGEWRRRRRKGANAHGRRTRSMQGDVCSPIADRSQRRGTYDIVYALGLSCSCLDVSGC